jgi:hypothetical protein
MKYNIRGKGQVNLSKSNFIASGGEGSIYVHGDKAFKIYLNRSKMIPDQKIEELASIKNSNVIKPEDVLTLNNNPVGYSMRYVKDTYALCQLFTPAFKKRENVTQEVVLRLVRGTQDCIADIHSAGVLVVDLNEMNFLVDRDFSEVYAIDVDSYETTHYPATALMDSVKDWHANGKWTEGSDWFSWGIVSFQLFTGIHPYRGKHKTLKNFSERMKANISVFNKSVTVPKIVSRFDTVIPAILRNWYEAVFEKGLREIPPFDLQAVVQVVSVRDISSTEHVEVYDIFNIEFASDVVNFYRFGQFDIVQTNDEITVLSTSQALQVVLSGSFDNSRDIVPSKSRTAKVLSKEILNNSKTVTSMTSKGKVVVGHIGIGGKVELVDLITNESIPIILKGDSLMESGGRIYVKNSDNIMEVEFIYHGADCFATAKIVASVMPKATKLFDGVAIQDMLGSWFASVFPRPGASYQIQLDSLDGYKVVDAKFDTRVLMVVGFKNGKYNKFTYRFRSDFSDHVLWEEKDITHSDINFVCLDNGICAHINDNEELVLFSSSPSQDGVKKISDPVIGNDMRLFKRGNEVLFARGKHLYKMSTKK